MHGGRVGEWESGGRVVAEGVRAKGRRWKVQEMS